MAALDSFTPTSWSNPMTAVLTFQETEFDVVDIHNVPWLTRIFHACRQRPAQRGIAARI